MRHGRATIRAAMLAIALGAFAPGGADAAPRQPKERTRITAADRKAAAEARKAKMEEARRLYPEVHGAPAAKASKTTKAKGGSR
jgi:hypothetical protein